MTHSTIETREENAGSLSVVYHTIDITALDSAGVENYDPATEVKLSGADVLGVSVRGLEDPTTRVAWDHVNGQLDVINVSDGLDVADNTDVGEVILEVVGA